VSYPNQEQAAVLGHQRFKIPQAKILTSERATSFLEIHGFRG